MLPQEHDLISKNQKLLYLCRRKEELLTANKKNLKDYIGISYPTIHKNIQELVKAKIIQSDLSVNSSFAYFAGFYITDHQVELELVDFSFTSVLSTVAPKLDCIVDYSTTFDLYNSISQSLQVLCELVPLASVSLVFDKFIDYKNCYAYQFCDSGKLQFYSVPTSIRNFSNFLVKPLQCASIGDTLLTYLLYLKEKELISENIVYYDLDENRISYLKNNILMRGISPLFGAIFPRYSTEQMNIFNLLEKSNGSTYDNLLRQSKDLIIPFFDETSLQIRTLLDPEIFVIGGKWIKKTQFENFYTEHQSFSCSKYWEAFNLLFTSRPIILNRHEQPQKGAGIFAAYCFFNWELRW